MQEVVSYPPATFSWVDLSTTDPEAAKQFYTQLFGWTFEDLSAGDGIVYTMLKLDGRDVAALAAIPPGQEGIPPHWNSYVTVDNLEESIARAEAAGGVVIVPATEVMNAGRMAGIQDPGGAVFLLWQPGTHIGAKLVNMPGSFCWNELWTHDPEQGSQFYTDLFGWTVQKDESMDYTMFMNNGRAAAGMLQIQREWGDMPANWAVYFAVEDCDATVTKAVELGGGVIMPAQDIPGTGRFAIIHDPQGAVFGVVYMERYDPPPSR